MSGKLREVQPETGFLVEVVAEFPEELVIAFRHSGVSYLVGGVAREF